MIAATDVGLAYGPSRVLDGISLTVRAGEFLAVAGPNGAGKSSLLAVLSGERRPSGGEVRLDGKPLHQWRPLQLARRRAIMLQHAALPFAFTVEEVVSLGFGPTVPGDVTPFLAAAGVSHLRSRSFPSLSGGERQRVQFARALAQLHAPPPGQTPLLLLDEPTSSLDPGHQHLILGAARRWQRASGGAAVAVLHDLSLAAQYADAVVLLEGGRVRWRGQARAMPEAVLSSVYGLPFHRIAGNAADSPPWYVAGPASTELPDRDDNDNHFHKETPMTAISGNGKGATHARSRR